MGEGLGLLSAARRKFLSTGLVCSATIDPSCLSSAVIHTVKAGVYSQSKPATRANPFQKIQAGWNDCVCANWILYLIHPEATAPTQPCLQVNTVSLSGHTSAEHDHSLFRYVPKSEVSLG